MGTHSHGHTKSWAHTVLGTQSWAHTVLGTHSPGHTVLGTQSWAHRVVGTHSPGHTQSWAHTVMGTRKRAGAQAHTHTDTCKYATQAHASKKHRHTYRRTRRQAHKATKIKCMQTRASMQHKHMQIGTQAHIQAHTQAGTQSTQQRNHARVHVGRQSWLPRRRDSGTHLILSGISDRTSALSRRIMTVPKSTALSSARLMAPRNSWPGYMEAWGASGGRQGRGQGLGLGGGQGIGQGGGGRV